MFSQLASNGVEPRGATGVVFFKVGVALGAGSGFLIGAILALSLIPPVLPDTSVAASISLVAPSSRYPLGAQRFGRTIPVAIRWPLLTIRKFASKIVDMPTGLPRATEWNRENYFERSMGGRQEGNYRFSMKDREQYFDGLESKNYSTAVEHQGHGLEAQQMHQKNDQYRQHGAENRKSGFNLPRAGQVHKSELYTKGTLRETTLNRHSEAYGIGANQLQDEGHQKLIRDREAYFDGRGTRQVLEEGNEYGQYGEKPRERDFYGFGTWYSQRRDDAVAHKSERDRHKEIRSMGHKQVQDQNYQYDRKYRESDFNGFGDGQHLENKNDAAHLKNILKETQWNRQNGAHGLRTKQVQDRRYQDSTKDREKYVGDLRSRGLQENADDAARIKETKWDGQNEASGIEAKHVQEKSYRYTAEDRRKYFSTLRKDTLYMNDMLKDAEWERQQEAHGMHIRDVEAMRHAAHEREAETHLPHEQYDHYGQYGEKPRERDFYDYGTWHRRRGT